MLAVMMPATVRGLSDASARRSSAARTMRWQVQATAAASHPRKGRSAARKTGSATASSAKSK
jgi:hypothetical protein